MKYFKTEASRTAERYIITSESFKEHTKHRYPFEQITTKGTLTQYGICPSCLNPIQLIGVSHKIKISPHGKHTGHQIVGFPDWNYRRYVYCPYARNGAYIEPNDRDLLPDIDQNVIDLYDLLREQFDRVVYLIHKKFHVRCSDYFWREALNRYVANRVYCYPWLTEANLPYIFALRGMQQANCYKQHFEVNSDIYNALSKHPHVAWADSVYQGYQTLQNNGKYFNLVFRLTDHQQKAHEGEELKESILFCIDDNITRQPVYQERIEIDETFFMNLIHANRGFRNQELLQIAANEMPPL